MNNLSSSIFTQGALKAAETINKSRASGPLTTQQTIEEVQYPMVRQRMVHVFGSVTLLDERGHAINNVYYDPNTNKLPETKGFAGILTGIESIDPKAGELGIFAHRGRIRIYNSGARKISPASTVAYTLYGKPDQYSKSCVPTPEFRLPLVVSMTSDHLKAVGDLVNDAFANNQVTLRTGATANIRDLNLAQCNLALLDPSQKLLDRIAVARRAASILERESNNVDALLNYFRHIGRAAVGGANATLAAGIAVLSGGGGAVAAVGGGAAAAAVAAAGPGLIDYFSGITTRTHLAGGLGEFIAQGIRAMDQARAARAVLANAQTAAAPAGPNVVASITAGTIGTDAAICNAMAAAFTTDINNALNKFNNEKSTAWSTYSKLFDEFKNSAYVPFATADEEIDPGQWGNVTLYRYS